MRITINRMRGSLAHKVGSVQAVFSPDEISGKHRPESLIWASLAHFPHGAILQRLVILR
jgi:hypothetical protein